jgi:hypothetical protein
MRSDCPCSVHPRIRHSLEIDKNNNSCFGVADEGGVAWLKWGGVALLSGSRFPQSSLARIRNKMKKPPKLLRSVGF